MENKKSFQGKYLLVLIAMCGFAGSAIGMTINCSGVFFTPLSEEFMTGKGAVSLTLTISTICTAVSGLFVPKLMVRRHMKAVIAAAVLMMAGGTLALSFSKSLLFMYVMNAIRGIGAGLLSFVTITMFINQWFYAKHGLATSIAMGFSGIAGAVLSPVFTFIITSAGWRIAYIAMAVLMFLFCMPAMFFPITFTPEESGMHAYGIEERRENSAAPAASSTVNSSGLSFLLLSITAVGSNAVIAASQHLPSYAAALGYSASIGALLLSLALIGNITSKLLTGTLADRFGARNSVLLISFAFLISDLLLLSNLGAWSLFSGSLLFGCGYGIAAVGITLMTKALFGIEGFVHVYPLISFIGTAANAVAASLIGVLYDATGSYRSTLWIILFIALLIIVCIFLAFRKSEETSAEKKAS